jgi:hypothetical protein
MTNCETYFALREKGYDATTETDFAAMKMAAPAPGSGIA